MTDPFTSGAAANPLGVGLGMNLTSGLSPMFQVNPTLALAQ